MSAVSSLVRLQLQDFAYFLGDIDIPLALYVSVDGQAQHNQTTTNQLSTIPAKVRLIKYQWSFSRDVRALYQTHNTLMPSGLALGIRVTNTVYELLPITTGLLDPEEFLGPSLR